MDLKCYDRWDDYTRARDEMFAKTDVPWAPWTSPIQTIKNVHA